MLLLCLHCIPVYSSASYKYLSKAYRKFIPNAPPISAPLVGMLTFTIPQSDPFGLKKKKKELVTKINQQNSVLDWLLICSLGDHYQYALPQPSEYSIHILGE